ncbi:MAG TPA: sugar transferase [Dehalococcoidia bacterium]|jgi:lipopolysaccharide/colanic/teichoic acid biosynthesis glycosyltransferase
MVGEAATRTVAAAGRPAHQRHASGRVTPAPQPHAFYAPLQRCLDVLLSVILLLVALPLVAVACLAILATSRQAPLLLQRRVGWLGREFTLLKLRTMRDEGEARGSLGAKPVYDERVTAVGRLLRRTSIDELPQLLNVLAGQMTLVGPRPGLPSEVEEYRPAWLRRLSVKPGLTGLWQVSGRSALPLERWMALDRAYLMRRSTSSDLLILLRTVPAVISMRGAW